LKKRTNIQKGVRKGDECDLIIKAEITLIVNKTVEKAIYLRV
jgi:hypothetical protein